MTTHAQRLWDLSQQRADEIGKSLTDIAREAGVTDQTVYQWRKGRKNVAPRTDNRVSRAFAWEPGSRQAILDGGDPTPTTEEERHTGPTPATSPPTPAPSMPLDQTIAAILSALPPDEQLEVLRRVEEQLQPPPDEGQDRPHRPHRTG